jgi:hypothetical protein
VPISFNLPARPNKKPSVPFDFAREGKMRMDCTGDECGCWTTEAACEARCDPNDDTCLSRCSSTAIRCSVCCCCDGDCPHYCG